MSKRFLSTVVRGGKRIVKIGLLRRALDALSRCRVSSKIRLQRRPWYRAKREYEVNLHDYRTPVQVCPRGCEFREPARRDVLTRTRLARALLRVAHRFETSSCPRCGSPLTKACARCGREIYAPVADRCQFCGIPQPWAEERRAAAERSSVQRWRKGADVNEPAKMLYANPAGRGDLWVIEGDITRLEVDAIVSNDDVDGQMWSRVSSAIKRAAGEDIERQAQEDKPYRLGQAWWTNAGDLPIGEIIHVASLDRHGDCQIETVRACIESAIAKAIEREHRSLAIATIGSGPASIDEWQWFSVFTEVAVKELSLDAPEKRLSIVLVLFEPRDFDATVLFLRRAVWEAWRRLGAKRTGKPPLKFKSRPWRRLMRRSRWVPARGAKPLEEPEEEQEQEAGQPNRTEATAR
ncbi:MAG TPA: macro domain-containing protein [Solirubrobacteraceae bacterium]|nr:macro domain-containing protein [Solirubrobacteraceae bacterium]